MNGELVVDLNQIGWLDGSTALIVVLIATVFGIYALISALKLKAKLLGITGLCIISIGYVLLGPAADFIIILITNKNLEPYWLYGLLSYLWTGPVTVFGLYTGSELLAPGKKKLILIIYGSLVILFEIILFVYSFTNPEAIFVYPNPLPNGTALLNTSIVLTSIIFILMIIFLTSGLIFNGFGFLKKSLQSTGIIRRKFLYLSLGWIVFIISGALDALTDPGIITFFIRIGTIISVILLWMGIRR